MRKIGIPENFALLRRVAAMGVGKEISVACVVQFLDQIVRRSKPAMLAFQYCAMSSVTGKAVCGVADGGRQNARHRQLAEFLMQREPAIHGAWNGHRQRAYRGDMVGCTQARFPIGGVTSALIFSRLRERGAGPEPL